MSLVVTLNVPDVDPTEMDLAPLGIRVTLLPPITALPKLTSLAVIVTVVLPFSAWVVLVTLPVPSVVIVIAPVEEPALVPP